MTKKENTIFVISQYFYGNRTGTEVERNEIDHFLRGELSVDLFGLENVQDVVRKTVRVPGPENIVIVYDQTQEDQYVNEEFPRYYAETGARYLEQWGEELKMHVSCEIPELGFKIHTRCFACRMDESGTLGSIEEGDCKYFIHYFPV